MKRITFFLTSILFHFCGIGQNMPDSIHPWFKGVLNTEDIYNSYDIFETKNEKNKGAGKQYNEIILQGFHSNNLFINSALNEKEKIKELVSFNDTNSDIIYPTLARSYGGKAIFPLFDSMGLIVTASGINSKNAAFYQYRVLRNKTTEITPWRAITLFSPPFRLHYHSDGSQQTEVAYLGEFKTSIGNSLTIEVRNKFLPQETTTISAVWINRTPAVIGTFTNSSMKSFIDVFKYQWKNDFIGGSNYSYYGNIELEPVDSLLILQKTFNPDENSIFFYLKDKIKSEKIVEYNLMKNNDSVGWKTNDFNSNIIWLKNLKPGKYTLLMRYSLQRQNISSYPFHVQAAWHQTLWFKIISAILGMICLSFITILCINRKQRKKIKQELLQKQQLQTELKSIRSQFNPHFVFNALNSIQGLITKNDLENANRYLSEFSNLLRDSLKESNNDLINLATEIKMLDSYLRLEQLRFGFNYSITLDSEIDKNAIEVPALLLQPLVENAVKHGIAGLYEKGDLRISFSKEQNDMRVIISDNGKGFASTKETTGYGLKLTQERIAVINKILPIQQIDLAIQHINNRTIADLLFKNWML